MQLQLGCHHPENGDEWEPSFGRSTYLSQDGLGTAFTIGELKKKVLIPVILMTVWGSDFSNCFIISSR
jgi:hypothetical protein